MHQVNVHAEVLRDHGWLSLLDSVRQVKLYD